MFSNVTLFMFAVEC